LNIHRFKINELQRPDHGRARAWHHVRRFLHIYDKNEKSIFSGHIETIVMQNDRTPFSIRFHIGNEGSETPWDGHILLFGTGFFWGHSAFRKLAAWLTRCNGYKWDTRDWSLRISDGQLWYENGQHDDMCERKKIQRRGNKKKRKRVTWRRGRVTLSIPELLWGPKRYTYEDVDSYVTTIKMPEGDYAVVLRLQKVRFGRTKVAKHKHEQSWTIEVDAPKGIPTHYDHSGGYKGDRTYGFGVHFDYPRSEGWQQDAEAAVTAWVYKERARTGFRKPQKVD
jgi:hypothetical protein